MKDIIKNIIKKNESGLTSLYNSARQHKIFFTAMFRKYKFNKNSRILPIT
jgi:translation initiation factor 2B subunit (eIF-2B alpha/beta/delta family)